MDWLLLGTAITIITIVLLMIHYNGYKQGHKAGFELGKQRINEYALKINEAQGERIKELNKERNTEIEKLSKLLSK